ncbi:MAG: DMT family transporter [Acidobacteriia bacterium]|nr:DMT family transporter [Terriglobia bacterium]
MSKRTQAELALLGVTFIWGTSFTVVKDALHYISAWDFLAFRFCLATLVLLLLFWKDVRASTRPDLLAGIWIGAILWLSFTLQVKGLELTTPSKSAFVTGFSVILVPVLEAAFRRRSPSRTNLTCAAVAFFGLYLLSGSSHLLPLDWGVFLTFLCAIGFALHILAVGHFTSRANTKVLVVAQIATTAFLATTISVGKSSLSLDHPRRVYLAVVYTAVLATALAFFTQNWAQKHTLPTRTALILSMEPVFAALVTYFTIHEPWTLRIFIGCLLIFASIIVSELKIEKKISLEPLG